MWYYVNLIINNDENKNKIIFIKILYLYFNSLNVMYSCIYKLFFFFI